MPSPIVSERDAVTTTFGALFEAIPNDESIGPVKEVH